MHAGIYFLEEDAGAPTDESGGIDSGEDGTDDDAKEAEVVGDDEDAEGK